MKASNPMPLLEKRGLIEKITHTELGSLFDHSIKVYIGFDPTADSLHLGHLVAITVLKWFQHFGHLPYLLVGGATGKIGDPSGKNQERPLLEVSQLEKNIEKIQKQLASLLDRNEKHPPSKSVNNERWWESLSAVDFLRNVGKHFRVNAMLTKESVKSRLCSEEGISFTEFSYQILQAYDFYHLFLNEGVVLQGGGSDQWGNITAGIELIRKKLGKVAYGFTYPLLTRANGEKFGKTEEGSIWLSAERCSPYDFYQYLYRVEDADVIKFMKMLTLMELEEIDLLARKMKDPDYPPNSNQKRLAQEVTRIVHGEGGMTSALQATLIVAPGGDAKCDPESFRDALANLPHLRWKKKDALHIKMIDLLVRSALLSSKGEASRLIAQGGAYLNNRKIENSQQFLEESDLIGGEFFLLGVGKKKKLVIQLH